MVDICSRSWYHSGSCVARWKGCHVWCLTKMSCDKYFKEKGRKVGETSSFSFRFLFQAATWRGDYFPRNQLIDGCAPILSHPPQHQKEGNNKLQELIARSLMISNLKKKRLFIFQPLLILLMFQKYQVRLVGKNIPLFKYEVLWCIPWVLWPDFWTINSIVGYINLGRGEDLSECGERSVEAMQRRACEVLDEAWRLGIRYYASRRTNAGTQICDEHVIEILEYWKYWNRCKWCTWMTKHDENGANTWGELFKCTLLSFLLGICRLFEGGSGCVGDERVGRIENTWTEGWSTLRCQ